MSKAKPIAHSEKITVVKFETNNFLFLKEKAEEYRADGWIGTEVITTKPSKDGEIHTMVVRKKTG